MILRPLDWIFEQIATIRRADTSFEKLGVQIDPDQRPGLEAIVEAFRQGYNMTLGDEDQATLPARLSRTFDPALRGFAHEGVGMCMTLLDFFKNRQRVERFLEICKGDHDLLLVLGVGFALARMPWVRGGIEPYTRRFPAGFDGLIINGYGFHEGCFKSRGELHRVVVPPLSASAKRCFDHGMGRALWFMCGASPARIARTLEQFPEGRRWDLWAGLGTACCYAGRAWPDPAQFEATMKNLQEMAGDAYREPLQLGVILATVIQVREDHHTWWVERTSEMLTGKTSRDLGAMGTRIWDGEREKATGSEPSFEVYLRTGETMVAALR